MKNKCIKTEILPQETKRRGGCTCDNALKPPRRLGKNPQRR